MYEIETVDIRDNLRKIIVERGYKQAVIARKAELTPAQLNAVLNLDRKLDVNELLAICNVMVIRPEEVFYYGAAGGV